MRPDKPEQVWTVDRIEGGIAVLVEDAGDEEDGRTMEVPLSAFTVRVVEGSMLRVPGSPEGEPEWPRAVLDEALRHARAEEARRMLDRLKGRDPGGDVEL